MNARKLVLAASLGLAGIVVPLVAAGTAQAAEGPGNEGYGYDSVRDNSDGYPSTQSPLQVVDTLTETANTTNYGFVDALDTFSPNNRPDGINGTDTEFPQPDPRFVEGPLGGLLVNGPLK